MNTMKNANVGACSRAAILGCVPIGLTIGHAADVWRPVREAHFPTDFPAIVQLINELKRVTSHPARAEQAVRSCARVEIESSKHLFSLLSDHIMMLSSISFSL